MTSYPKNIKFIQVWERMSDKPYHQWFNKTYDRPRELIVFTQGKKNFYFMPYGSGYNCEDGVYIDILSQEEFENKYSMEKLP